MRLFDTSLRICHGHSVTRINVGDTGCDSDICRIFKHPHGRYEWITTDSFWDPNGLKPEFTCFRTKLIRFRRGHPVQNPGPQTNVAKINCRFSHALTLCHSPKILSRYVSSVLGRFVPDLCKFAHRARSVDLYRPLPVFLPGYLRPSNPPVHASLREQPLRHQLRL